MLYPWRWCCLCSKTWLTAHKLNKINISGCESTIGIEKRIQVQKCVMAYICRIFASYYPTSITVGRTLQFFSWGHLLCGQDTSPWPSNVPPPAKVKLSTHPNSTQPSPSPYLLKSVDAFSVPCIHSPIKCSLKVMKLSSSLTQYYVGSSFTVNQIYELACNWNAKAWTFRHGPLNWRGLRK